MLLKLSLLFFLAGLAVDLWFSAVDAGLKWTTEELKVSQNVDDSRHGSAVLTSFRLLFLLPLLLRLRWSCMALLLSACFIRLFIMREARAEGNIIWCTPYVFTI